jgi:hypothetical protein
VDWDKDSFPPAAGRDLSVFWLVWWQARRGVLSEGQGRKLERMVAKMDERVKGLEQGRKKRLSTGAHALAAMLTPLTKQLYHALDEYDSWVREGRAAGEGPGPAGNDDTDAGDAEPLQARPVTPPAYAGGDVVLSEASPEEGATGGKKR